LTTRLRAFPGKMPVAPILLNVATTRGSVELLNLIDRETRQMDGTIDKAKGRIKEAAGALTNDKSLKREGKLDQLAGDAKDAIEGVVDTVKGAVKGKTPDQAEQS